MTYVFDIDGTICSHTNGDYGAAVPDLCRIQRINELYDAGHTILFLTARGMGRFNNDAEEAIDTFYDMTMKQLDKWKVKYHQLFLGKPSGDYYIDDKGTKDEDFFKNKLCP